MSDTKDPAASIQIEKKQDTLIARPQLKMMDDDQLKALGRVIDESAGPDISLVIVDLSAVKILPSLALGLLVQISNKCKARQQKLKLAAVVPQLRQVFTITRLDRIFDFADSVEAAMQ